MTTLSERTESIRPFHFLAREDQPQLPMPLIRITTCGLLTIEICEEIITADPPQARYVSLTPDQLHGRGTGPALKLLKLLRVVVRFRLFRANGAVCLLLLVEHR